MSAPPPFAAGITGHASRITPFASRGGLTLVIFLPLAMLSLLFYLGASYAGGFVGFPLDDAWIHQGYARNLAERGEFAFIPGQPSAGSTSPLWSGLLALGYVLKVDYRVWTYALGGLLLVVNAWLGCRLVLEQWPERSGTALLAGIFIALEWRLDWAAASGMETLLFSALVLLAFVGSTQAAPGAPQNTNLRGFVGRHAVWVGLIVGISVLARPDGLTLLPFTLGSVALQGDGEGWRGRRAAVFEYLLGFGAIFATYLAFNRWLGGVFWPNTFYAKQAEYAVLREAPFVLRLVRMCALPFVGAPVLLLPGMAAATWLWSRQRRWKALFPLAWAGAFIMAYALRLPATYQHGRYLIPIVPVLVVVGVGGVGHLLHAHTSETHHATGGQGAGAFPSITSQGPLIMKRGSVSPIRIVSRAWVLATGLLVLAFWVRGAGAYTRDVQIIETEMVATAHWISRYTEPDALIAAHDIGAVGYFSGRKLLDMAGLVSPDVIPFIRDEDRLRAWLDAAGADYLVTFPAWYPGLVSPGSTAVEGDGRGVKVFQTTAPYSPAAGGENMALYRWLGRLP